MEKHLDDFSVLTFDCYGTLIDWETGIWDAFQPLLLRGEVNLSRSSVLRGYADIEHELEAKYPDVLYSELLQRVHATFAAQHALPTNASLDEAFAAAIAHWPAFGDSATALRSLGERYKLVILSNVHNAGIDASMRKLGVNFAAVYTAEDIGSYKPAEANFHYMLDRLASDFGLQKGDVLHTAQSLFHDHGPANRLRIANAWIDRQRLADGGDWGATAEVAERPSADFHFYTLGDMATAVSEAFR